MLDNRKKGKFLCYFRDRIAKRKIKYFPPESLIFEAAFSPHTPEIDRKYPMEIMRGNSYITMWKNLFCGSLDDIFVRETCKSFLKTVRTLCFAFSFRYL